jgi:hypothetical protein
LAVQSLDRSRAADRTRASNHLIRIRCPVRRARLRSVFAQAMPLDRPGRSSALPSDFRSEGPSTATATAGREGGHRRPLPGRSRRVGGHRQRGGDGRAVLAEEPQQPIRLAVEYAPLAATDPPGPVPAVDPAPPVERPAAVRPARTTPPARSPAARSPAGCYSAENASTNRGQ